MKILMVLTSHDQMGDTGHKTGFWLEEFTSPYYVFKDAGADITIASPKGGQPPVDPNSEADDALTESTRRFQEDAHAKESLASTKKLADARRKRRADSKRKRTGHHISDGINRKNAEDSERENGSVGFLNRIRFGFYSGRDVMLSGFARPFDDL